MINQLVQGVLLGGYYALIACGLSFMFSVMRIINLAHGSLAVLAAFGLWLLAEQLRHPALPRAGHRAAGHGGVGWLLQRYLLERSARGGALLPILTTFGLAIVIDNLLFEQFGADTRSLAPYIGSLSYDSWEWPGNIYVGKLAVLIFVVAVAAARRPAAVPELHRRWAGRSAPPRKTPIRPASSASMPVRANAVATAIAMVTVGLAGAALGMRATFDPYSGAPQLLFAFEAAVIGGAGSLWGTLVGGIVLALAQTLGAQLASAGLPDRRPCRLRARALRPAVRRGAGRRPARPAAEAPHERAWRQTMKVERWTPASRTAVAARRRRHRLPCLRAAVPRRRRWSTG